MPDEPEKKEEDPVEAIRNSLTKALGFLKQLLGQEDRELQEEMREVEGSQSGSGQTQPASDQADSEES